MFKDSEGGICGKLGTLNQTGCPLVKACRHFASVQQEIEPALLPKSAALLQLDQIPPVYQLLRLDVFCPGIDRGDFVQ
jgi:hypothetical protein